MTSNHKIWFWEVHQIGIHRLIFAQCAPPAAPAPFKTTDLISPICYCLEEKLLTRSVVLFSSYFTLRCKGTIQAEKGDLVEKKVVLGKRPSSLFGSVKFLNKIRWVILLSNVCHNLRIGQNLAVSFVWLELLHLKNPEVLYVFQN